MGKHQHRRSVSVRGPIYRRLKALAAERGTSISAIVEHLAETELGFAGITEDPGPAYDIDTSRGRPRGEAVETIISQHFTF